MVTNYSSWQAPTSLRSGHSWGTNPEPPRLGQYIILVSVCAVFCRPPQQLHYNSHVANSPWLATSSTPLFNASQACKELGGSHSRLRIGPDPSPVKLYCAAPRAVHRSRHSSPSFVIRVVHNCQEGLLRVA
jgi:hypothetical protein